MFNTASLHFAATKFDQKIYEDKEREVKYSARLVGSIPSKFSTLNRL